MKFESLRKLMIFVFLIAYSQAGAEAPPPETIPDIPTSSKRKKPKGSRPREKETEGTQAPNRFEVDNVVKSKYELNGQPLEVDPD